MELIKRLGRRRTKSYKESYGLFLCEACGREIERPLSNGKKNKTCGCLLHGGFGTRLYRTWESMKRRCLTKSQSKYHIYGGRGIKVCQEWIQFKPFREWALVSGYEDGLQIDRIDNDKGYTPENCRFVTAAQNSQNKSTTKLDWEKVREIRKIAKTKELTQREIAENYGISATHVGYIIRNKTWIEHRL